MDRQHVSPLPSVRQILAELHPMAMLPLGKNGSSDFARSPETVGLILLDSAMSVVYISSTAETVLSYCSVKGDISGSVLMSLQNSLSSETILLSGRRKYICRKLLLESAGLNREQPYCALVLERVSRRNEPLRRVIEQFHFTPREREVVTLLATGLTSKEIAQRLNISPHTVKGYIHLIMTKMGTSTRSGIVGKLRPE